jgi:hypothetical protein
LSKSIRTRSSKIRLVLSQSRRGRSHGRDDPRSTHKLQPNVTRRQKIYYYCQLLGPDTLVGDGFQVLASRLCGIFSIGQIVVLHRPTGRKEPVYRLIIWIFIITQPACIYGVCIEPSISVVILVAKQRSTYSNRTNMEQPKLDWFDFMLLGMGCRPSDLALRLRPTKILHVNIQSHGTLRPAAPRQHAEQNKPITARYLHVLEQDKGCFSGIIMHIHTRMPI